MRSRGTERFWSCYHEAGHAVMAVINGLPLQSVEVGEEYSGAKMKWWYFYFPWNKSRAEHMRNLEVVLAGIAGEALVRELQDQRVPTRIFIDSDDASRLAAVHGFQLGEVRMRVNVLLHEHRELVRRVAEKLDLKHQLTGEEVRDIVVQYFEAHPILFPLVR